MKTIMNPQPKCVRLQGESGVFEVVKKNGKESYRRLDVREWTPSLCRMARALYDNYGRNFTLDEVIDKAKEMGQLP